MTDHLTFDDLRPGMLIQDGREVYKVSTVYPGSQRSSGDFTAQLLLPVPPRTIVRRFDALEVVKFKSPSDATVEKLDRAYGIRA